MIVEAIDAPAGMRVTAIIAKAPIDLNGTKGYSSGHDTHRGLDDR